MKVDKFLELKGMSQAAFALGVKCVQGRVSQIIAGEPPSMALASRIVKFTGGKVTYKDLAAAPDYVPKAKKRPKKRTGRKVA